MGPTAFLTVAGIAEQLQIVDVMCSPFRLWYNVVNSEVLQWKSNATAIAKTLLLTKERVLVGLVVRQLAYIGALRNVFTVYKVVE